MDVVQIATALSNRKRFEILKMLYQGMLSSCCDRFEYGEQGACVADVVTAFGMSQSTISHHLAILEEAGLIRREIRGLWTCYFPNHEAIAAYTDSLQAELNAPVDNGIHS